MFRSDRDAAARRGSGIPREGDVTGWVVEAAQDFSDLADVRELALVRQDQLKIQLSPVLAPFGRVCEVFEVMFLGHVEIDRHPAAVGQGRQGLVLPKKAAQRAGHAADQAVEAP